MKTTKLYLAAALVSLGAGIKNVDKSDPRHMEFELTFSAPFSAEDDWFNSRVAFWNDKTLQVVAPDYADAIQKLKGMVHE